MSKELQIFDRYYLFLSTDYFVQYWHLLSGGPFASSAISVIQSASREAVVDFMGEEEIYWNIDFSSERHERSNAKFKERLKILPDHDRAHHDMMQNNFCEDEQEQINITFALSYLHQVLSDPDFRLDSGLIWEDVEIVSACIPSAQELEFDMHRLQTDWLASDSNWDRRIRDYTPDVPEYVWSDFNNAHRKFVKFRVFVSNLAHILTDEPKAAFLRRLSSAIESHFPENSNLQIPRFFQSLN